jgi:TfoX/Sxy family transcriptional regulator of competence genes
MGCRPETIDFLVDQLRNAGTITAKKMFGDYGLYCDGTLVALVCDDELFVKPTTAGEQFAAGAPNRPPYKGAKPAIAITADRWEDRDWLVQLINLSRTELIANPAPKRSHKTASTTRTRSLTSPGRPLV